MILINNNTDESWICTQSFAAYKIGVNQVTIWRWKTAGKIKEVYNHWTLYMCPHQLKQPKGFAIYPDNIKKNKSYETRG